MRNAAFSVISLTIHKSQGSSVGDGKPTTRLQIALSNSTKMEEKNLGLLYTALSRVTKWMCDACTGT